jgi:ribosomal protein S12 methylthiotransferase accessory factor
VNTVTRTDTVRIAVRGTGQLAEAVVSALRRSDVGQPAVEVVAGGAVDGLHDVDLVVGAGDTGLTDELVELSRAARHAGKPFVPVWIEGLTGHAGPIVRPGGGPCLRCYLLRRAANDQRWELTDAVRRSATDNGVEPRPLFPPLVGSLADLCALQIIETISERDGHADPNGHADHNGHAGHNGYNAHADRNGRTGPDGRTSRDRLRQVGRALELNLIAFSAVTRHVLRVPGCPECGPDTGEPQPRADGTEPEAAGSSLDRLLSVWPLLVDPVVGVVREIEPLPVEEDEPAFVHYLSTASDTSRLTRLKNFANNGGVSITHSGAVAKALGEGVERYCSAFFDYDDLLVAPYRELPGRATPPGDYALYTQTQLDNGDLPWQPLTEDTPVRWTTGRSLATGDAVFVPAAMVYVPYHYRPDSGEPGFVQPISTGLAAGTSFAEAALSGLCEAVERDAFTITWQARLSRPRIDPDTLPVSCRDRLDRFTAAGLRVHIMDITTDLGLPTLLTIAVGDRPTSPAVAVAAATHPDPEVALVKSLEELAHTRKFARQVMDYTPALPVDVAAGHPEVLEQKHHLRFYCPQEAKAFAEFAWASSQVRRLEDVGRTPQDAGEQRNPAEQLADAVALVTHAGLEAIACDLTTPDVARLGLRSVRVVVPGLHPLFMGHRNRALGGSRLYEVPARLGERGPAPGEPDNPFPHPFP